MPVLNENSFLQRLQSIVEDERKDNPDLRNKLKEKGVECSILIPLFEILLGFDSMNDIEYEVSSSEQSNQRFDFLIDKRFLLEAKQLGVDLKDNITKQIREYIYQNEAIDYGILSNGYEYAVFIQKSFIKKLADQDDIKLLVSEKMNVLHVFTISIDHKDFQEIIKLFSKNEYRVNFKKIALFALSVLNPKKKATKISPNRALNRVLQTLIKDTIDVKPGFYLNDINEGKIQADDLLVYENDEIKITIKVKRDGRVSLVKGGVEILNMNRVMEDAKFSKIIDLVVSGEWNKKDIQFNDPYEIIRKATGKKNLYNKEQYEFKRI